ncbi:MAG: hypothetical protein KA129_01285 [Microthrixaceae bacterium]|nr:hypothetical protein [Microthrixaceae bacterium]
MKNLWGREPALILGLVAAAITLAVSFGLELSDEQNTAITVFLIALLSFVTRSKVTPS